MSSVGQVKRLETELDEEKSRRDTKSSSVPQMNGPEMQLYEVQSKNWSWI